MYFYMHEKSKSKNGHKVIKNASFQAAISAMDRGHRELLIAEIAASNGVFLMILRPHFDFQKFMYLNMA